MAEVICAAIAAASAIAVAVIEVKGQRDRKAKEKADAEAQKEMDERADRRAEESRLSMQLMSASVDLAYVTSLAVTGGHTNGNVEAAQKKAALAQNEYDNFLKTVAAKAVTA